MYTNMERSSSFWAGFTDCTEEAIAFLLESENISEADPIIQGLREHLRHKQVELGLSVDSNKNIPTTCATTVIGDMCNDDQQHDISVSESMDMDMSLDRIDEGYNSSINITQSDISSDISFSTEEIITTHGIISSPSVSDITTTFFVTPATVPPSSHITSIPAQTVTVDSFTPIMHTQIQPLQQQQQQQYINTPVINSSDHQNPEALFCDPFQDPVSLAILAQNNPEIASVAQELFQLLSQECDDSLLCDEETIDDEDEEEVDVIESESQNVEVSADDNGNVENMSECSTHQLNCYSECVNITDSLPAASQSQSQITETVTSTNNTVGQFFDDKENFHPETSNSNSTVTKVEHSLADSSVQNTVLRLSPQNH